MNDQPERFVWLNGALVAEAVAQVSLFDRGYLYGDGLFETLRAYAGQVFRLTQHLARLAEGAQAIGLRLVLDEQQLAGAITELLAANHLSEAYLRLTVSRGVGLGPLPPTQATPTISIIARPLQAPPLEQYQRGWRGVLVESALAPGARLSQVKALSYLDKLMAKLTAQEQDAQEAILVNCRGEVTEGATSNVFLVMEGRLLTPPLAAGLLNGITRSVVLELAAKLRLPVSEVRITPELIYAAQECFLTNSVIELMPLSRLACRQIGAGRGGPVTAALQTAYQRLVADELSGMSGR